MSVRAILDKEDIRVILEDIAYSSHIARHSPHVCDDDCLCAWRNSSGYGFWRYVAIIQSIAENWDDAKLHRRRTGWVEAVDGKDDLVATLVRS